MMREWLSDQGMLIAPALATLLFLGIFIGVVLWIFRPGARDAYQQRARLPLEDEVQEDRQRPHTQGRS